jgi:hypothetical protein
MDNGYRQNCPVRKKGEIFMRAEEFSRRCAEIRALAAAARNKTDMKTGEVQSIITTAAGDSLEIAGPLFNEFGLLYGLCRKEGFEPYLPEGDVVTPQYTLMFCTSYGSETHVCEFDSDGVSIQIPEKSLSVKLDYDGTILERSDATDYRPAGDIQTLGNILRSAAARLNVFMEEFRYGLDADAARQMGDADSRFQYKYRAGWTPVPGSEMTECFACNIPPEEMDAHKAASCLSAWTRRPVQPFEVTRYCILEEPVHTAAVEAEEEEEERQ